MVFFLIYDVPPVVKLAEESSRGLDDQLVEYVKFLMTKIMAPGFNSTGGVVQAYIRKAIRTGAWRHLKPESRSLLIALRGWRKPVKSHVLRSILLRIFVEIELHTTRGKAIFYGILEAMSKARELLLDLSKTYLG